MTKSQWLHKEGPHTHQYINTLVLSVPVLPGSPQDHSSSPHTQPLSSCSLTRWPNQCSCLSGTANFQNQEPKETAFLHKRELQSRKADSCRLENNITGYCCLHLMNPTRGESFSCLQEGAPPAPTWRHNTAKLNTSSVCYMCLITIFKYMH